MAIYEQHRTAFSAVSAHVVMLGSERVATVAFKFGNAVTAYVHYFGTPMTRGRAGGGGYDRKSAACRDAVRKTPAHLPANTHPDGTPYHDDAERAAFAKFHAAIVADDGSDWRNRLRDAGFVVWQAV
jgi:hypothetical protein